MPIPPITASLPQLIVSQEFENRLSKAALIRLTDDNKSGAPDKRIVEQIIRDASASVWAIHPSLKLTAGVVPDYIIKLTLDYAQGLAFTRYPQSAYGTDGYKILEFARRDLKDLEIGAQKAQNADGSSASTTATGAGFGVVRSTPIRRSRVL